MTTQSLPDIQAMQSRVEQAIRDLQFDGNPAELYEPITYILSLGGKRMRPVLAMLGCDLFSGNPEGALSQALAVEIFHNFTLVHDDIMDEAPLRRNQPTVHHKWNQNLAILSGDVMLVIAYQQLAQCEASLLPQLLDEFNATAIKVCEGQQMDMNFETSSTVELADYITMIGLKTAALLAGSLKIGALLGGATEKDAQLLYDFGYQTGVAFQLQDDILDVFGDPEKFGKRVGGDIISNKKTWLLLKALELAEGAEKTELNSWLDGKVGSDEEKVQAVTAIYNRLGVKESARTEMESAYARALNSLAAINAPEERKAGLKAFTDRLMLREF